MIKYYLDIGCIYEGDEKIGCAYNDHQNWNIKDYGLIGILKLKIDVKKKTKEEILFKQIFTPYVHQFAKNLISDIIFDKDPNEDIFGIRENRDVDLIVGWNSRDFDFPIIINNLGYSEEHIKYCLDRITKKDRDLLDISILREIPVKGGLEQVVKRLKINHDLRCKNCPTYSDEEDYFFANFDYDTNRYNNNLKAIKQRNEFDVRILPLLEEKLGYLYHPRIIQDKFHKKWR